MWAGRRQRSLRGAGTLEAESWYRPRVLIWRALAGRPLCPAPCCLVIRAPGHFLRIAKNWGFGRPRLSPSIVFCRARLEEVVLVSDAIFYEVVGPSVFLALPNPRRGLQAGALSATSRPGRLSGVIASATRPTWRQLWRSRQSLSPRRTRFVVHVQGHAGYSNEPHVMAFCHRSTAGCAGTRKANAQTALVALRRFSTTSRRRARRPRAAAADRSRISARTPPCCRAASSSRSQQC
jgi:hypothetical protein